MERTLPHRGGFGVTPPGEKSQSNFPNGPKLPQNDKSQIFSAERGGGEEKIWKIFEKKRGRKGRRKIYGKWGPRGTFFVGMLFGKLGGHCLVGGGPGERVYRRGGKRKSKFFLWGLSVEKHSPNGKKELYRKRHGFLYFPMGERNGPPRFDLGERGKVLERWGCTTRKKGGSQRCLWRVGKRGGGSIKKGHQGGWSHLQFQSPLPGGSPPNLKKKGANNNKKMRKAVENFWGVGPLLIISTILTSSPHTKGRREEKRKEGRKEKMKGGKKKDFVRREKVHAVPPLGRGTGGMTRDPRLEVFGKRKGGERKLERRARYILTPNIL